MTVTCADISTVDLLIGLLGACFWLCGERPLTTCCACAVSVGLVDLHGFVLCKTWHFGDDAFQTLEIREGMRMNKTNFRSSEKCIA